MSKAKRLAKRGFTLIELMIVVVIIGILASLAIYGVQKYVANAKSAEARMSVGRMAKDALSAFEGEQMDGTVLSLGATVGTTRRLCASAAALVPAAIQDEGVKYQPTPSDFRVATEDEDTGWRCLGFSMDQPINFSYGYNSNVTAGTPAADGDAAIAFAQAQLGGQVTFIGQSMTVQQDGSSGLIVLTLAPALSESSVPLASALAAGTTTTVP